MKLTSAFRCDQHNKDVGGSSRSQHRKNRAVDFRDKYYRVSPEILRECAIEAMEELSIKGGIGIYKTFVHMDIRGYTGEMGYAIKKREHHCPLHIL